MRPILIELGGFQIPSYGFALALSFAVGMLLARRRGRREGIAAADVEWLALFILLTSLLGARFLYAFVEHFDHYSAHPLEFFDFESGGLSFFGGLILTALSASAYCRLRGLSFWQMADVITPSIALGLGITKIGCFLAGCCYGRACSLPWAVVFSNPQSPAGHEGIPLHPAQLYESLVAFMIFFGLLAFERRRRFRGEVFVAFVVLYGATRAWLETFRGNPGRLGDLTTAQALAIPLVLLAVAYAIHQRAGRSAVGQSTSDGR